jgi:vitamin B12 transporter
VSTRLFGGILAAFLSAAAAASAQAQTAPSPSPSPSAIPEIGHIVTADRRSEPIDQTTRPTFVVDREQIEAYGARTIGDALQGVPGVALFHYGPFGAEIDYGLRGSLNTQTLVLIDGVPITDPTTGAVDMSQLSTIGVERIEVVESGSSTLYGTNAAGGVINIITSVPRNVYLLASTGSFGDRDVRVAFGNGYIGIAAERHVATNDYPYPTFNYGPTADFPGTTRSNAFGDQSAALITADSGPSQGWRVRARLDLTATSIGVPGGLAFLSPNATQTTSNTNGLFDVEHPVGVSTLSLTIGGSGHRLSYIAPSSGGESDVYTGRAQVSLKDVLAVGRFDAVTGIDLARESGIFSFSPGLMTPNIGAALSQSAAYLQAGYEPFARSRIVAGVRAENDGTQGSVVDPSFGGGLQFGAVRFAGNVTETFRVPTLQDLYYPGFSNPNLVPERAQASDATVGMNLGTTTLSLGWFARGGSNFIVYDPVLMIPINEQRAQTAGLQMTANLTLPGGMVLAAGLTDVYESLDLVTLARLPRSPVGQANLSLSQPFGNGRWSFGARWNVVGSDGDDAANVTPLVTTYDAYNTVDAYVRYKITPNAIVSARGFNLTNEQYAPIFGYPAPGRSWQLELSTR